MPAFWNDRDVVPAEDRHFPAGSANGRWVRGTYVPADAHDPKRRSSMFADVLRAMMDVRAEA